MNMMYEPCTADEVGENNGVGHVIHQSIHKTAKGDVKLDLTTFPCLVDKA